MHSTILKINIETLNNLKFQSAQEKFKKFHDLKITALSPLEQQSTHTTSN